MAEVWIAHQQHAALAVGLPHQSGAELTPAGRDADQHALGRAGEAVACANHASGERDDGAQLVGTQRLHASHDMPGSRERPEG